MTSPARFCPFCKRGEKSNKLWISSNQISSVLCRNVTASSSDQNGFSSFGTSWTHSVFSFQELFSCLNRSSQAEVAQSETNVVYSRCLLNYIIPTSLLQTGLFPSSTCVQFLSTWLEMTPLSHILSGLQQTQPTEDRPDRAPQPQTLFTGETFTCWLTFTASLLTKKEWKSRCTL